MAGILMATALTPSVQAQAPGQTVIIRVPSTTATVPDGGTVTLYGYDRYSESRTQIGAPILGQSSYVNRGFGNVGYGRSMSSGRVTATVRIIDLREEEFRQTGFRSR
jgi:type II secretory pathway component GspD/PulD (secretin)